MLSNTEKHKNACLSLTMFEGVLIDCSEEERKKIRNAADLHASVANSCNGTPDETLAKIGTLLFILEHTVESTRKEVEQCP